MSNSIDLTLLQTGSIWTATLAVVQGLAPSVGVSSSASAALDSARQAALVAVFGAQSQLAVSIGPVELVLLDVALRNLCSTSLYGIQNPTPAAYTPSLYGEDISTFAGPNGNDLDPYFLPISGVQAIGEACARRLLTPAGSLIGSPGDGLDVHQWLSKGLTASQLQTAQAQIEAEILKDERVGDCAAKVVLVGSTLTISLQIVSSSGPFALVLTVGQLSQNLQILQAA